jgi:hypothetical protein
MDDENMKKSSAEGDKAKSNIAKDSDDGAAYYMPDDDVKPSAKTALDTKKKALNSNADGSNVNARNNAVALTMAGEFTYINATQQVRAVRPSRRNKDNEKKRSMIREQASADRFKRHMERRQKKGAKMKKSNPKGEKSGPGTLLLDKEVEDNFRQVEPATTQTSLLEEGTQLHDRFVGRARRHTGRSKKENLKTYDSTIVGEG